MTRCIVPKDGFLVNLEFTGRNRLYRLIKRVEDYERMAQKDKDFFYEFENNLGKKYLISCPDSCKNEFLAFL